MAYTILCDNGFSFTAAELLSPHFAQVKELDFAGAMEKRSGDLYVVTMSSAFSGAYQAACAAREALLAMHPERRIVVLNTKTASAGELAVARRLHDFLLQGMEMEAAVAATEEYIQEMSTLGVLSRTDVLRQKGMVSRLGAAFRARFGAMLLLEGRRDGKLQIRGRDKGGKATLEEVLTLAKKRYAARQQKPSRCIITYSGCPARARELGRRLREACGFRELVIVPASDVAARYMGSGALMAAF